MLEFMTSANYRIDSQDDIESISYKYWNVKRREIWPSPRYIIEPQGFTVPHDLSDGYRWLKEKIERGDNINSHLSKNLLDTSYEDRLLNDWGIFHFHLKTSYRPDGWVDRGDPLLFAFIKNNCFYSLRFGLHKDLYADDFLRIIHENWPELISQYRLNIQGCETDRVIDRKLMRKSGIMVPIMLAPDVVYQSPGGGYSCTGISVDALAISDMYLRNIEIMENNFRNNIDYFVTEFERMGCKANGRFEFQFCVSESGFHVLERNLQLRIWLADSTFSGATSAPAISITRFSFQNPEHARPQ